MKMIDYYKGLSNSGKFDYLGEDVKPYRWKKLFVYAMTILSLSPFIVSCKSDSEPISPPIPEEPLIYNESKGVEIMMKALKDKGLIVTENTNDQDFYIPWNGKMVKIDPDFGIGKPDDPHNRPYFAFGEFLSAEDGFTNEQMMAALDWNATYINIANGGKGSSVMVEAGKTEKGTYDKAQQEAKAVGLTD